MKTWTKGIADGNALLTYYLTKEYSSEWFIKVFPKDGKYTFIFGKRVVENQPSPERFYCTKGWKSATTAKKQALRSLFLKINEII